MTSPTAAECITPAVWALLPPATQALYTAVSVGLVCDISMATNTLLTCTWVGTNPEGVAVNNWLGELYVANNGDNTVSVLELATAAPWSIVPVFDSYGYLATTAPYCPFYIETAIGCSIGVGPGPENVAVDLATNYVWVTNNGGMSVSIMQPHTGMHPLSFSVTTVDTGFQPVGVAVDPKTDCVWVTNFGSGTVSVLYGMSFGTCAGPIKLAIGVTGVSIDDTTGYAYVANAATNTVTPISLTNYAIGTGITVGSGPFGIANFLSTYPGIDSLAFVTDQGSNQVSVIDLVTGLVTCTIAVP
jgi:YVTN family beta-propeller protein